MTAERLLLCDYRYLLVCRVCRFEAGDQLVITGADLVRIRAGIRHLGKFHIKITSVKNIYKDILTLFAFVFKHFLAIY